MKAKGLTQIFCERNKGKTRTLYMYRLVLFKTHPTQWVTFHNTVVSPKYAPPFATLALVQSAGGLIHGMQHFLSRLHPPPSFDREMLSNSVDAGFIRALQFDHRDLEPDCVGVSTRGGGGWGPSIEREAERCYQC